MSDQANNGDKKNLPNLFETGNSSAPDSKGTAGGGNGIAGADDEKTVVVDTRKAAAAVPRPGSQQPRAADEVERRGKELASTKLKATQESTIAGKKKQQAIPIRPEDSIPIRLAALAMVILLLTGSAAYVGSPLLLTFMLIWLAMTGTFLSYMFRDKRPIWINILPTFGALAVIAYLVVDCASQFSLGKVNLLYPFTQALAGFLALHCFDLRTRSDFSISALIALGLLVCTAGAASDMIFIVCIMGYVSCLSLILYFDGVSRSRDVGPSRPIGDGRPASMPKPRRQARAATSVVLVPVLSLPILTLCMFFCMPRSSSVITWFLENVVRPHVAVSQSDRVRGISPGGLGSGGTPSLKGSGSNSQTGAAAGGGGGTGGTGGVGNSGKGVNPLDPRTKGEAPRGIGQGGNQNNPYKEGFDPKPDNSEYLPPPDPSDDIVLRINAPRMGYIRRIAFDQYDGKSWSRSGPIAEVDFGKDEDSLFPVGNANAFIVPRDCPVVEVKQQITVDMPLSGSALPAMWVPQLVAGPFSGVAVQADGTLRPDSAIESGVTYEVKSWLPVYRAGIMRSMPLQTKSEFKKSLLLPPVEELEKTETDLMKKYLQLPEDLPERVKKRALKVAGQDGNWFVKAERICDYLRNKSPNVKSKFKYKIKDVYRVKGGDFVDNFLFQSREGNCVDFASAFVIMARAAGVPTRLVGGYLPGKFNEATGFHEIRVKDGHAWAEIYVPNWCWIPFDPTPNGTLPEFAKDEGFLSKLSEFGLANPFGGAFQGARGTPGAGMGNGIAGSKMRKDEIQAKLKEQGKDPIEDDEEDQDLVKRLSKLRWEPIVILCILITSGVVGYILYQQHRARNTLGIPPDARKSTLLFFQVVRDLRKYKIVRLPTDTPLELAERCHIVFEEHRSEGKFVHPELEPLLTNFMEVYMRDRFGRSDRTDDLESMSEQIKHLVSVNK